MKLIYMLILTVFITGCQIDNSNIDQQLYAQVFNQCVHDSANGSAFMNDIINACASSARSIATIPRNKTDK